jgi:hypothetical protein
LVADAVHVYVVPVTALGLVIATLVLVPEHIIWAEAVAVGTGRTVTTKFTALPLQPVMEGIIL